MCLCVATHYNYKWLPKIKVLFNTCWITIIYIDHILQWIIIIINSLCIRTCDYHITGITIAYIKCGHISSFWWTFYYLHWLTSDVGNVIVLIDQVNGYCSTVCPILYKIWLVIYVTLLMCSSHYRVSLSTVVLNSRDCQGKLWFPKKRSLNKQP